MSRDHDDLSPAVPLIDELWGALESDDDLVTDQEVALVDARLEAYTRDETQCLDWEWVSRYICSRQKSPTGSRSL